MSNMHEDNGSTSIIFINNSGRDLWCTVELSVSSENNYDFLRCYNNSLIQSISGEVASDTKQFLFRNGDPIGFTYTKDGSQSRGRDCGYIKSISFFEYDCNELNWKIIPNNDGHTASVSKYLGNSEYVEIPSTITRNGVEYTITAIDSYLFKKDHTQDLDIKGVIIPNTVTTIENRAFYHCDNLTSIVIPSSVNSIGDNAFSGCSSLGTIKIPSSVASIGNYAFEYCSGLTSIEIPSSVISIGQGAFRDCM